MFKALLHSQPTQHTSTTVQYMIAGGSALGGGSGEREA